MNILLAVVYKPFAIALIFLSLAVPMFGRGRQEASAEDRFLPVEAKTAGRLEDLGFVLPERPLPVPDLGFDSLAGGPVFLTDTKGSLVMLNFWASWCSPCRAEMPSMQRLWEELKQDDFLLLAVSVGERKETVASYIEEEGYTFPVLLDPGGVGAGIFQVQGIPVTWLIGPDGMIIGRYVGSREWDSREMTELFKKIMNEGENHAP